MTLRRLVVAAALVLAPACGDRADPVVDAGAHTGLECAACHTGPPAGDVMPAVAAGSCAACHASDAMPDTVEIANVSLSHAHPGGAAAAEAGCAACHSHDAGDAPITAPSSSCFFCHADPASDATAQAVASLPEAGCRECHVQPTHTGFAQTGEPVDHATVLARGISCQLCHYDVVEGSGAVAPATCRECHGRLGGAAVIDVDATFGDDAALHTAHLEGDVRLSCARCHATVEHRVVQLASALVLDCAECHAAGEPALREPVDSAVHRSAQMLYSGLSPAHRDIEPALKFLERVSCDACHTVESTRAAGRQAIAAINTLCVDCHGPRFGTLLEPWLAGMEMHSARVAAFLRTAEAATGSGAADSIHAVAAGALRLVEDGHGVHNLPGADSLLRDALDAAGRAYRRAGMAVPPMPDIGPSAAGASCVRCHYGIDTDPATRGEPFEHGRHILDADLPCAECHGAADFFEEDRRTFNPAHGTVTVSATECSVCHHVETPRECAACHTATEIRALAIPHPVTVRVPHGETSNTRTVSFDHAAHGEVACAECHSTATPDRPAIECTDCHVDHHEEVASPAGCAQCHTADLRARHERTDHLSCGACHTTETLRLLGTADRAFCLQCHVDQVDHEVDGQCSRCHLQLTPDAAMRTILSATVPPREAGGAPR